MRIYMETGNTLLADLQYLKWPRNINGGLRKRRTQPETHSLYTRKMAVDFL